MNDIEKGLIEIGASPEQAANIAKVVEASKQGVILDREGLTEQQQMDQVNEYLNAEQSHVKDSGKEAMQKDLMKSYAKAKASYE